MRVGDCRWMPEWFTLRGRRPNCGTSWTWWCRGRAARFLCVLDEDGRTRVALTGQKGLSEYIADHFPQQVMVQRVGGKPGQGNDAKEPNDE